MEAAEAGLPEEQAVLTRAALRKREREEAPIAARTRGGKAPRPEAEWGRPAGAARGMRQAPRAASPRAPLRSSPRQKKRARDAAPAKSPRGKKGALAAASAPKPSKDTAATGAEAAAATAAAASGASGGAAAPEDGPGESSSAALNALLRKLGGGSFEDIFGRSTDSSKFASILKGLQTTGNDSAQLQALSELCEVLSMGTEESLRHFSSESFVPVLMNLLNADWNPDVMLYSCRALSHMMEALPNSQRAVVQFGCVEVLCAKLMSIEYIDLAEQALLALGKLAESHGRTLFRSGGLMAVLSYLDFFPTGVQRAAMSTAAAMCRQAPPDCFSMVKDAVPNLTGLLAHHDQRTLESTCTCFIRLSECYSSNPEQIAVLAEHGLVKHLLRLVTGCDGSLLDGGFAIAPPVSQPIFTGMIKLLAAVAGSSAKLRQDLLDAGAANVIAAMLSPDGRTTSSAIIGEDSSPASTTAPTGSPVLVCNSSTQLIEVLGVVNAMLSAAKEDLPFEADLEPKPASVASPATAKASKPSAAEVKVATTLAKSVFSLLITVCTVTQTTAVAHKSLRALNKIISVMPKDKLAELPFGNVARFIGDLLVSNDLVVLSGALNMSEVLMAKLEDTFRESFVREGVVHEIQNLGKKARKEALARTGSVDVDTQRLFRTASLRLERAALEQAAARRRQSTGDTSASQPDIDAAVAELQKMRQDPRAIFIGKVQQHAERFRSTYFADDGSGARTKLLLELREISKKLSTISEKPCKGAALAAGNKAFARVAELMSDDSKVSVFELSESGLVGAVVKYIRGNKGVAESRKKLELLCKHFDANAAPHTDESNDTTSARPVSLSILISKLHACIKSQESLPIHLNEVAGGVTEGLRLLSRPFKLRLVPKEDDGSLADLSPNVVLIEPLATIHSVHEFLLAKLTEAHEARERGEMSDLLDSRGGSATGGGHAGLGSLSGALRRGSASSDARRRSRDRAASSTARKRANSASAESADDGDGSPPTWECDIDGLGTWVEYAPEVNSKLAAAFTTKSQVTFKRSTHTYTIDCSSAKPEQINKATGVRRSVRRKTQTDEMHSERSSRRRKYRRGPLQEQADDPFGGLDDEDILERALAEQAALRRALKASARAEASAASTASSSGAAGALASSSDDDEPPSMPDEDDDDDDDSSPEDGSSLPDADEDDVFESDRMETDEADESVDDIALGASPAFGSAKPKSGRSPTGTRATKRSSGAKSASASASAGASAASGGEAASSTTADGPPPPFKLSDDESIPSKLSFSIRGAVLDHETTIFHAVQAHGRPQHATSASSAASASGADDDDEHAFTPASRAMWSEIYELHYCREEAATTTSPSSKATLNGSTKPEDGEGLCDRTLASALGDDIGRKERSLDSIRDLLVMLRVCSWLMTPSRRRQLGLSVAAADGAAGSGLDQSEVLNSALTGKVLRQLQDPLSLCSGVPNWMDALIRACPYVFSFESKHQYFACTQLGLSRGLGRLQAAEQAAGIVPNAGRHGGSSAEPRSVSLRIQRQKVRISRSRILESATKVLELYGTTKGLLEVEFFGEVGTGLGPTLEFYTVSSRELQRKSLGMWRSSGLSSKGAAADGSDEYVPPSEYGLFPAPQPLAAREATHVSGDGGSLRSGREGKHALPDRFRLLGRLIAKALQDNRLLDIHLSPLLYKLLACPTGSVTSLLTRTELSQVDPALAKTVSKLSLMLEQKQAAETSSSLSAAAKSAAIAAINYDGAPLETLYLDFTCPGYPDVELCEGGKDKAVTLDNLEEYIEAVVDATLGNGVRTQVLALRAGFEDIVPLSAVDFFEPAEMDRLICGENAPWSIEELRDSCKADHGYTLDSPAVQFLFQTLAEMTPTEQRSFLCFATGSPRLPIGGLAALKPQLTIVRRGSDGDGDDPDFFLPTVMTCANYIKLPKYTSAAVLKTQLLKAITEGQGSFHMS